MPIVPILCGVLVIAGIVALALSGTTWRWYHITLVSLVMLLSLVWFYMAARVLTIETAWRTEVTKYERAYLNAEKEQEKIISGEIPPDPNEKEPKPHLAMSQLRTEVDKIQQGRGRVWGLSSDAEVVRKASDPATGQLVMTVNQQNPGLDKNTIVYVFEFHKEKDVPIYDNFLGAFEVTAVNGQEVRLAPVLKLRASELARIAARRSDQFILYEVMPTDSRELYSDFPNIPLPDAVKPEFTKDGKPADANEADVTHVWRQVKAVKEFTRLAEPDEIERAKQTEGQELEKDASGKPIIKIAEGTILELDPKSAAEQIALGNVATVEENDRVYVRPLRDYVRLYRDLNLQIEEVLRKTTEVNAHNAAVQDALAKAGKDKEYREKEVAALKRDKKRYLAENARVVSEHASALERVVADVGTEVEQLRQENRNQESILTATIRDAAGIINRRAPLAAAPPGG